MYCLIAVNLVSSLNLLISAVIMERDNLIVLKSFACCLFS